MNPGEYLEFDEETNTLLIEPVSGIQFLISGKIVTGEIAITKRTTVRARPRGRLFDEGVETSWTFDVNGEVESKDSSSGDVEDSDGSTSEDVPSTQPFAASEPHIPSVNNPNLP